MMLLFAKQSMKNMYIRNEQAVFWMYELEVLMKTVPWSFYLMIFMQENHQTLC